LAWGQQSIRGKRGVVREVVDGGVKGHEGRKKITIK